MSLALFLLVTFVKLLRFLTWTSGCGEEQGRGMTSNYSQGWMLVCIFLERVSIAIIKELHESSLQKEQLAFIE